MFNLSRFNQKAKMVEEWLTKELSGIRAARATPALLDIVLVEAYGVRVPIKQVAAITTEDQRTLRVSPYDRAQIKEVEKAITAANLGLSVAVDEKGVRAIFPELSGERRQSLLKLVRERLEQARVSLRKARDEAISELNEAGKKKEIREDDKFRLKNELQKSVDVENDRLEEMAGRKEREVMN